jgi:glycosyltransferase involved in cell wall biosynthesis
MREVSVSILVPVYNEEKALPEFLDRLGPVLDGFKGGAEAVFVDDASRDGSVRILSAFCSAGTGTRLVRHGRNRGRGNAVLSAARVSVGGILVTLDADLENPPEAIPSLIREIRPGVSCITGFRTGRSRRDARGLASWVYNRIMAGLTGLDLHDCNCGMKAFRRGVLEEPEVAAWIARDGDYLRFFVYLIGRLGHVTVESEIRHKPRRHGKSRYRWTRYAKAASDLWRLLAADARSGLLRRRPASPGFAATRSFQSSGRKRRPPPIQRPFPVE